MPLSFIVAIAIVVAFAVVVLVFRGALRSGRGIDPISSSIVVASGAALLVAGAYHNFSGPRIFLLCVGSFVGTIGMIMWLASWYRGGGTPDSKR